MKPLKFTAEIKQVNARKAVSLDIIYKLVLQTDDVKVLSLGALPADTMIKVTVEVME